MAGKNKEISRPVVIAVEGLDYLYLLLSQISEFQDVQLWDFSAGDSSGQRIRVNFESLAKQKAFAKNNVRAMGIITDAEFGRDAREDAVKGWFRAMQFAAPSKQMQIEKSKVPSTGYLIMPHDKKTGCLEHACLEACKLPPEQVRCAEDYLTCVSRNYESTNENHRAKVKVHALIAGHHEKPTMTLGESAKANVWDFDHPSLKIMIDFIRLVQSAQ